MEKIGKDIITHEKDGFFHCQTCSKKLFTKLVYEKHLKNGHSQSIKLEMDQDQIPAARKAETSPQECKIKISTTQERPVKMKLELTSEISNMMDTAGKNLQESKSLQDLTLISLQMRSKSKETLRKKQHQCDDCKTIFQKKGSLQKHKQSVHEKLKPYQCQDCFKSFVVLGNLQRHHSVFHNKIMLITCQECAESFSYNFQLKKHIYSVHKHLRQYHCNLCEKKYFQGKTQLTRHVSTVHKKLKPHQCLQCKRYFGIKLSLQVHINGVHKKLKPFQCQKCQLKFTRKQNLNTHWVKCEKVHPLWL